MAMFPADLYDIVKNLQRRIDSLERGLGRGDMAFYTDNLQRKIFEVTTDFPGGVGFFGATPIYQRVRATTLEEVITIMTMYGLTD